MKMRIDRLIESLNVVGNDTVVRIQHGTEIVTSGHWYEDNILAFDKRETSSFQWVDNTLTIKIK